MARDDFILFLWSFWRQMGPRTFLSFSLSFHQQPYPLLRHYIQGSGWRQMQKYLDQQHLPEERDCCRHYWKEPHSQADRGKPHSYLPERELKEK